MTLIDRLLHHATAAPAALALSWMPELSRDRPEHSTQAELLDAVRRIAGGLAQLDWPASGTKLALLAFPPGLDFLRAFLACLMARVVAVPVAMPRRGQAAHLLEAIAGNCGATMVLTAASDEARLAALCAESPALARIRVLSAGSLQTAATGTQPCAALYDGPLPRPQDLAFLQYTSGSTSRPKGVCVQHANLMANLALIKPAMGMSAEHVMVNWLPHYHDMGLIGGLLLPVDCGVPSVSLAPSAFIKRPLMWLQTIAAQTRPVISGGPNFAYQLCADRVSAQDAAALQLGHWTTAFNGAEPVRAATLQTFARHFAPAGFVFSHFVTCYGLAETTLLATGGHQPVLLEASVAGLEAGLARAPSGPGDARQLVSSGPAPPARIAVVDPATRRRVAEGTVGDIWVSGPSVPAHYFNDPAESERTFNAQLADPADHADHADPADPAHGAVQASLADPTRFLVTGDLGTVVAGQLYVTGRAKELLIINGRNVYPHDVEALVLAADPRLQRAAVFAHDEPHAKAETVVLLCELDRAARHLLADPDADGALPRELEKLAAAVRVAAAAAEIRLDHVRFLGPLGLAMTTSGKISYGQNRRLFTSLPLAVRSRPTSCDARRTITETPFA